MENNTITRKKRKRIWPIEIIAGLFIMMIVFFIAVNVDIKTTQETLSDTAHYINATALQDLILRQKPRACSG